MQCPRCEQQNEAGSNFCRACGAPLASSCPACGAPLPVAARFCSKCGRAVAAFASPAAYTPKHLAEKIIRSRAAVEGERKQVTVLFADLKDSMELLADRDPEEARRILDPVLELMMGAVHAYEGTVNQVMGDGIMALFGAPIAREDHAVRACFAALRMQDVVKQYADRVRRSDRVDVRMRVGLNSGEVVVRSIGSDLRTDYTAVGQAAHLAARMEQLAAPGTIVLTPATLRMADAFVDVKPLGARAVKGLSDRIELYQLVAATPVRSRLQAMAARGLTTFVGRVSELAQLHETLELARSGRGQLLAVVGAPGVGKSRLLWEFTHSSRAAGGLLVEAAGVSYGKPTAYLPVAELLKTYFGLEPHDDARKIREKVSGKLVSLDPALEPALEPILGLLDVPSQDGEWSRLDPPQRKQRILDAVKRVIMRESQVQPVMLVFEDLHWIDAETQAVLDALVESVPAARLLLLVTYRPEYQHGWASKTFYRQLRVDPLRSPTASELLDALVGRRPEMAALKRMLIERTGGNPFFLEEAVHTLVEMRALTGDRGAYHLAKAVDAIEIPATVQALLAARIDRLPEEKDLLQLAAVIGPDVPYALLREIADVPEDDLRRRLARLQAAEFLYEAALFPELEYTFTHALTQEVAYRSLLHDVRRALHARIADAIERVYGAQPGKHVDRLAHHAVQGELWSKAVLACRQAGAKAYARSAPRAAVAWFEQALAALEHLPETRETLADAVDLRLDLRYSLIPLGEFRRVIEELNTAERLASELGDQRRLGTVAAFLGNYFTLMGDVPRGVDYGQRTLAIGEALEDLSLRVLGNGALAMAHARLGAYREAIGFARNNVAALQGALLGERFGMAPIASVYSRTMLGWSLAELGEFAEAAAVADEAVRIADDARHPYSLCLACQGAGIVRLRQGELAVAIAALERGLALCRSAELPFLFPTIVSPLASAYAASGRVADAFALLDRGVKQAASSGDPFGRWLRTAALSDALLAADRIDDALPLARKAIEMARFVKARSAEAWTLRLLGEIVSRGDRHDFEEARRSYVAGSEIAERLGMRPLTAHCHLGLGRLYRRAGDYDEGRAHLKTAAATYGELNMQSWLERAEAELAGSD
jgi:class 3 adenylate cyclase/tetratricopeptide (TPR) repeat protein